MLVPSIDPDRDHISGWRTPTFFINGLRYNGMSDLEELLTTCKYFLLTLGPETGNPINKQRMIEI